MRQEFAPKGTPKPMFRFIERAASNSHETSIILKAATSCSFSDIRPNAIRGADRVFAHGVLGKDRPSENNLPNFVGQLFGQLIHPEILKVCPGDGRSPWLLDHKR